MNPETLIRLCRECAASVYGARPPTARYSESVARLLMGTAATESLLKYRRQIGFSLENLNGAWGLWQTEQHAVTDSLRYLRRRGDVLANAARFVDLSTVFELDTHATLLRIHDDDRFAVLFARLHYLRVASSVPDDLRGQAGYWKTYYNTRLGKGTVEGYMRNWADIVEPAL